MVGLFVCKGFVVIELDAIGANFVLKVSRGELDLQVLLNEYGFNLSVPDSTNSLAVLFTRDPYAAASFLQYATPAAHAQLDWIGRQVAASSALFSNRHLEMPSDKQLIPFQVADCDYILSRAHALDADEMGLGKTPSAIVVANEIQARRVCVVCPAQLRGQWERRIHEWSTIRDLKTQRVITASNGVSAQHNYLIISYELARNKFILRALTKMRFELLIIDECRYAKKLDAARTRALFGYFDGRADDGESVETIAACLMDVSDKVLCLDGTPTPNRPGEAYVFMRALDWASIDWASHKAFRERFNPQSKGKTSKNKVWTHEEEGRLPELQNRLRAHIMCRHLKSDVRDQLKEAFPYPVYDLIYLEETKAIKLALDHEKLLDIDPESFAGSDIEILGEISTVRKEMGVAMAPQVADYLQMLLEGGASKLVVFGWHAEVLDYLQRQLAPWGIVRVDGRDSGAGKEFKVHQFINNQQVQVILGNVLTLGTGTDGLQHVAHHCLFAEPDWVHGNNEQCVTRLARMGQKDMVLADFFLVRDSMAEKVLATALRKGATVRKMLDRSVRDLVEVENW